MIYWISGLCGMGVRADMPLLQKTFYGALLRLDNGAFYGAFYSDPLGHSPRTHAVAPYAVLCTAPVTQQYSLATSFNE